MNRLLICPAIICALLTFCSLVKSEHDGKQLKFKNNIYIINQRSEALKEIVQEINDKSEEHIEMLKELKSAYDLMKEDNSVCNEITGNVNATYTMFNTFEELIATKIKEIKNKQIKEDYLKSCQGNSVSTTMSETLNEINKKVENFEQNLQILETLEKKLQQQQSSQTLSEEQLQLVKAINAKLAANQEKFEKFDKELPSLLEMTKIFKQLASPKNQTLPIEALSELKKTVETLKQD